VICPRCGAAFVPHHPNQRYCDASCQHEAATKAYKLRNPDRVRAWNRTAKLRRKARRRERG
jgi:uncharacterized OB-fold protein